MKTRLIKTFSVAISLALIIAALPVVSFNVSAKTEGVFTYGVNNFGAVILDVDNSVGRSITIPDVIGGCKVSKIAENAFADCDFLEDVHFSSSKTDWDKIDIESGNENITGALKYYSNEPFTYVIEDDAAVITEIDNLASGDINIPEKLDGCDVTEIRGNSSYASTCMITSVTIPNTVKKIGDNAFSCFSAVETLEIPDSVVEIGNDAFYACSGITDLVIPDSVKRIGSSAFGFCSGLKTVLIGNGLTDISDDGSIFKNCPSLESITVDDKNTVYRSVDNCLIKDDVIISGCKNSVISDECGVTKVGKDAFCGCDATEIIIPEGVTEIGDSAFESCQSLENVVLPDSVVKIGNQAFNDCPVLDGVYYSGEKETREVISVGTLNNKLAGAFWHYNYIYGMPISDSQHIDHYYYSVKDGKAAIYDVDDSISGDIEIPAELGGYPVTVIDEGAFYGCAGIKSVKMPSGVTDIVYCAFQNCTGIKSVSIPDSVTKIDPGVFIGCTSLQSIDVDKNNTFYHSADNCLIETESKALMAGMKNSVIPDDGSVTTIVYYAFGDCSGLESIDIPSNVTSIGGGAFSGCTGLTEVNFSSGLESIGNREFSGCLALTDIELPKTLIELGGGVFSSCSALESVNISNGLAEIPEEAFLDCKSLKRIILPSSIYEIRPFAFKNCYLLTKLVLPKRLDKIGGFAFENCYSLKEILMQKSVQHIGEYAFFGCFSIADVYYSGTETERNENLKIAGANYNLIDAQWHYDYKTYFPGDMNSDSYINNKDIVRLFQYLSGWDVYVNEDALDINGDRAINNKDLTRLFKYLSGFDVQIF